jgi:hypothetical protein
MLKYSVMDFVNVCSILDSGDVQGRKREMKRTSNKWAAMKCNDDLI